MDRRNVVFSAALSTVLPCCLYRAFAQTSQGPKSIGMLINGAPAGPGEKIRGDFVEDMARLGHVKDRGYRLDPRFAEGVLSRLPTLAAELVESKSDVIVAFGGPASKAAAAATTVIPVVFSIVTDPVALGLVASLDKPGGNLTGVTSLDAEQSSKQMELLKAAFPGIKRVAILSDATIPGADANGMAPIDRANIAAAKAVGLEPQVVKLKAPTQAEPVPDFAGAFAAMKADGAEAVLILELPIAFAHRKRLGEEALAHRIPAMFPGGMRDAGGVITFGTSVADTWRRVPVIVDKILKGTSPGTIPVEFVTRRELVFNLKTADQLGVSIPKSLLSQAEVVR